MAKLSKTEFMVRALEGCLEQAKNRLPSTTRLPDDYSGLPELDETIVKALDWLKRHGFDRPLEPLAQLVMDDPRRDPAYDQPDKPWFDLVSVRLLELYGMACWYRTVRERGKENVALPLFLTRLGCETADDAFVTCQRLLVRARLIPAK